MNNPPDRPKSAPRPEEGDEMLLRALLDEARTQGPPAVDLARVEQRLMAQIKAGQGPRFPTVSPSPSYPRWVLGSVAVVAAAAALLLWVSSTAPRPAPPPAPEAKAAPPSAPARQRLAASDQGLAVARPGLASLWLDPGSEGWLDEPNGRLSLALDRGAVNVDVVPQKVPDRVEVVTGKVRVRVKGTRFRVARVDERVEVDVEHGTVQVSSTDEPSDIPPITLIGPDGGSFSAVDARLLERGTYHPFVDRGSGAQKEPSSAGTAASIAIALAASSAPLPDVAPTHSPSPSTPAATAVKTAEPTASAPAPVALSLDELKVQAKGAAESCFAASVKPAGGVSITVEPDLTMQLGPNGRVQTYSFSSALPDAADKCFRGSTHRMIGPANARFVMKLTLSR